MHAGAGAAGKARQTRSHQAVVVGAGPVGLAAAIACKQRGIDVAVIERRAGVRDKACGEGLMPAGVAALGRLGLDAAALESASLAGVHYFDGPLQVAGEFTPTAGRGIRRTVLLAALERRAAALGIPIEADCSWQALEQDEATVTLVTSRGRWRASYAIAADGLHSPLRAHLGLTAPASSQPKRFGMRRHFACPPWSEHIEVHWAAGAEAYVTPVAADCVGVAFLWGPRPAHFEQLLARFPALQRRLAGRVPTSSVRGAGPLAQPARAQTRGRVALVGDAAGYLDALTGEGLTLGFLSALALAPVIAAGRPLADYERAYAALSRSYLREAAWLLALAQRPRARRAAMWLLAHCPWLMQGLLTAHCKRRPLRASDLWRPAARLAERTAR